MATTQFEVRGAWKADGSEGSMIVDADNQRAAEHIASARGLMVESALPVMRAHSVPPPIPAAASPRAWKIAQAIAAVVMIAGGVSLVTGLRFADSVRSQQQNAGAVLALLGLPAFVAGFIGYLVARFVAWFKR